MADSHKVFQLYLLGQMRHQEGVSQALAGMCASSADIETARRRMIREGFELAAVSMSAYERFLGRPDARGESEHSEHHEKSWITYHFDAWPSLSVVVFGSRDGIAAGLRFEREKNVPAAPMLDQGSLLPWRTVHSDVVSAGWAFVTREEWYPVLDVEVELPSGLDRALLRFDFGLLQTVDIL
jgi:hypothetical protein